MTRVLQENMPNTFSGTGNHGFDTCNIYMYLYNKNHAGDNDMNIIRMTIILFIASITVCCSISAKNSVTAARVANTGDTVWGFDFIDSNTVIFTEKGGKLGILTVSDGDISYVKHSIPVTPHGQGGLMDVHYTDTDDDTHVIFITYSKRLQNGLYTTALSKGTLSSDRKSFQSEEIFVAEAAGREGRHFGSRLALDTSKQHIYMSIGERGERNKAQELTNHNGTILRLTYSGEAVETNPFTDREDALDEIFAYGNRNPQGLYLTNDGILYETEFGPKGGDEINIIEKGKNYGWPKATHGREYSGDFIAPDSAPGTEQPIEYYTPVISPSGMMVYEADYHDNWSGDMFIANLSSRHLRRVRIRNRKVIEQEELFKDLGKRIRHVDYNDEGRIFFSTDSGDLYRIEQ